MFKILRCFHRLNLLKSYSLTLFIESIFSFSKVSHCSVYNNESTYCADINKTLVPVWDAAIYMYINKLHFITGN